MNIKIFCQQWGHEHLETEAFFAKVKEAGYDGVDTWIPEKKEERQKFIRLLDDYDLLMVSHQHQATGKNIDEFCKSFEYYLNLSLESDPILINSHSGKDHFTLEQQLQVIDVAENFAVKKGIRVAHETHRGRIGFGPVNGRELFAIRPKMKITADFSHWVCVTESYLGNFEKELDEAIIRAEHIHARVGFTEGPQIPDPRSPFWQEQVDFFLNLWKRIIDYQSSIGTDVFTITPEFGPPPYMWTSLKNNSPVIDQWEINLFMKSLLQEKFQKNQIKNNHQQL
jgi:sugar phosphate isomerase/epimerase